MAGRCVNCYAAVFSTKLKTYQELPIQFSQNFLVQHRSFFFGLAREKRVSRENLCSEAVLVMSLDVLDVGLLQGRARSVRDLVC
jgi:hypothetical protein